VQGATPERAVGPRVPSGFFEYVRGLGPGIVVAMAWLGSGDLVSSAVSGANYGYALLWGIVIALLARYLMVSAMARYQLCNSQGDETILQGFARLWRGFPFVLAVGALGSAFVYNSFHIRGAGTALNQLFGGIGGDWAIFLWSALVVAAAIALALSARQYKWLERVAVLAVTSLGLTFLAAAILSGVDILATLRGLLFSIPADEGPFGATLVVISLIGVVGGSVANILYVYLMREKGWHGPAYRRLQVYDLLTGITSVIVINLAVWIVAAETLNVGRSPIEDENDLASMMELIMGPIGSTLLWIGLFFATFDNVGVQAFGYTKIFLSGLYQTFTGRRERYNDHPESDPMFRVLQIGLLMILPLLFSTPFAPNFIVLTIFGGALPIMIVPIIIVAILWLTNKKGWFLPGYETKWWNSALLFVVGIIGIWGTFNLIQSFIGAITGGA
jgi:Mn2+/Fe2+ NRAMP family transporter